MRTRTCSYGILLLLSLSSPGILAQDAPSPYLWAAVEALGKAIDFFDNNYDRIILDGIYGLRVAEGQLLAALSSIQFVEELDLEGLNLIKKLGELRVKAGRAAENALPYLERQNALYYKVFTDTIKDPFLIPYIARQAQVVQLQGDRQVNYEERQGDSCFAQLIGMISPDGKLTSGVNSTTKCQISRECAAMMSSEHKSSYALTHQVLFFIEAQHLQCWESIEEVMGPAGLDQFEKDKCNQVYSEAVELTSHGQVEEAVQDLFLEQGVVCGMIGFENFLRSDWLEKVIAWQKYNGCYTDSSHNESSNVHRRRLLIERELEDGCLSHKSGLGAALLGIYVRYLVEHGGQFPNEVNY